MINFLNSALFLYSVFFAVVFSFFGDEWWLALALMLGVLAVLATPTDPCTRDDGPW